MKRVIVRAGLGGGAAILGLMLSAGAASASDSVRITGVATDSVRITSVEPDGHCCPPKFLPGGGGDNNRDFGLKPLNRDYRFTPSYA